jgi:hypothetical protein
MRFIIYFFFFTSIKCRSQDYKFYYSKIDSAYLLNSQGKLKEADSIFNRVFESYIGFPDDCFKAASNIYRFDKTKSEKYLTLSYIYGASKKQIKVFKRKEKIYVKINFYRIKRKVKKTKSFLPFIFMLFKDQYARKFAKQKISEIDKKNLTKIKCILTNNPYDLSRFATGEIRNSFIHLLLIHQKFDDYGEFYYDLINQVKLGNIHREILATIIERDAIWTGRVFYLNKQKIEVNDKLRYKFSNKNIYASSVGSTIVYIGNKRTLLPINPNLNINEVNELREFLYLPYFELFKEANTHQFYTPTILEFEQIK